MSEQIRIPLPRQRHASHDKLNEERVMSESEVYAAQSRHHEVDQRADDILDEIDAEIEFQEELNGLYPIGRLAIWAA